MKGILLAFRTYRQGFRDRVKTGLNLKEYPTEITKLVDLGVLSLQTKSSVGSVLNVLNYESRRHLFAVEEAHAFLWIYVGLIRKGGLGQGQEVTRYQEVFVYFLFKAAVAQGNDKNIEHILYLWKQIQEVHSSSPDSPPAFQDTRHLLEDTFPHVNFDVKPEIVVDLSPSDFFETMQQAPYRNLESLTYHNKGTHRKHMMKRPKKERISRKTDPDYSDSEEIISDEDGVPRKVKKIRLKLDDVEIKSEVT